YLGAGDSAARRRWRMAEPRIIARYGARSARFPEAGDESGNRVLCRLVRPELLIGGGSNACAHRSDDTDACHSQDAQGTDTEACQEIVPIVVENRGGSSRTLSHDSVLASNPSLPDKGF